MTACKMPGFRFHDLRHTFRTQGAHAGVQLEVMMAQLGHMDRETSIDYVHIQQQALQKAKARIEKQQTNVLNAATGRPAEPSNDRRDRPRLLKSGSRANGRFRRRGRISTSRRTGSAPWR